MKIAILTLPLHINYGGILQAYALQTVLQRMGHDVDVLQCAKHFRPINFMQLPLVYGKRLARKLLKDWRTPILYKKVAKKEIPIIRRNTNRFIETYLNLREINSLDELSENEYDAFVVGSDQVWRYPYFRDMWFAPITDAFLAFTKGWNVRRISYAASFGMDNIDEYSFGEKQKCAAAIRLFDAVSVREDSGVGICKNIMGIDASHVLDPTMLLSKDDYISLVEKSNVPRSPGDMLCYILDKTSFKSAMVEKIAKEKSLTPFNVIADTSNRALPIEKRVQPPVESWLRGFIDAKFVVTDSFHACVFSIIFGKPFLVIGNARRGMGRFVSLLKEFGLENHLIIDSSPEGDLIELSENQSVPLAAAKEKSLSFLKSALNVG